MKENNKINETNEVVFVISGLIAGGKCYLGKLRRQLSQ